jgi:hypothetical protein
MKKINNIQGCIIICILICIGISAHATNYYVSNSGNDANAGTSPENAWKTIAKVNSSMSVFTAGDSILLKRGDVFKEKLTVTRSGSALSPIVIASYGAGQKPILDGKDELNGWVLHSGNIWKAYYSSAAGFVCNNIFKDGKPLAIGRWPNATDENNGYRKISSVSGVNTINDNTLIGTPDWTNASIVVRFNHWSLVASKITSHSGSTINYQNSTAYTPYVGWGYYVQNHIGTLDAEGEWYYDTANKYVYIYSATNPSSSSIEIAAKGNLITFNTGVSNVVVDGIECVGSANSAVEGVGSLAAFIKNIHFKNCNILYAGLNGITFYRANHIRVSNSYVYGSNFHGLNIQATDSSVVENNIIKACGLTPGMAPEQNASVRIGGGANAVTVQKNYFDSTGYGHIVWSGSNHLFKKNLMKNYCMRTDDGAAIYFFGNTQLNNRIDSNIIVDGKRAPEGIPASAQNAPAAAIYADEGSANISITNNTIARSFTGVNFNNSAAMVVRNNTFFDNDTHLRFTRWTTNDPAGPMRNYDVVKNIVFGYGKQDTLIRVADTDKTEIENYGKLDSNYYSFQNGQIKTVFASETVSNQNRLQNINEWTQRYTHDSKSKTSVYALPFKETLADNVWFNYNETEVVKNFTLPVGSFKDAIGNNYSGSVSVGAYSSLALYKVKPDSVFAQDNVVLVRLESLPDAAMNGTSNKAYVEEYDAAGSLIKSIDLSEHSFYVGMKDLAEGIMGRSANGEYLTLTGYKAQTGITGSTSRAVALIKYDGTISFTTINSALLGNNAPRSAATVDGTGLWFVGSGSTGVIYTTAGTVGGGTAIAGTSASNNTLTIPGTFTSSTVFTTSNVNVSVTTGLAAGQLVTGVGIVPGTTVTAVTNNTITLSAAATDLSQTKITVTRSANLFETLWIHKNQLHYSANAGYRIGIVGDSLPTGLPDNQMKGLLFGPSGNGPSATPEQVFTATVNGQEVMYVTTQTGGFNKYLKVDGVWLQKGSNTVPNVTLTGNASSGSNLITAASAVTGLCPGMFITGTGINTATYITGINGSTITLSSNATATGSSITLTGRHTFYNLTGKVIDSTVVLYAVKNAPLSIAYDNTVHSLSQVIKIEDISGPAGSVALASVTTVIDTPPAGDGFKSVGIFSPINVDNVDLTLPLSLYSFKAEALESNTSLIWQASTVSEVNYFEVEKSVDGRKFNKIGIVSAVNAISDRFNYKDNQVDQSAYYRVKLVGADSKTAYSTIEKVSRGARNALSFRSYPNPANSVLNISYGRIGTKASVKILTLTGVVMSIKSIPLNSTFSAIDISKLVNGIYLIELTDGQHRVTQRFIKGVQ